MKQTTHRRTKMLPHSTRSPWLMLRRANGAQGAQCRCPSHRAVCDSVNGLLLNLVGVILKCQCILTIK
jgi:hypothetical protein